MTQCIGKQAGGKLSRIQGDVFKTGFLRTTALALVAGAVVALARPCAAVPYASGISNNAGTVSFILNEAADDVKVVFNGGASTNFLGALTSGAHTFSLGAATSYEIQVTKTVPQTWTQISDDNNPLIRFYAPRGIAVNQNPANLALFGRIYVATTDPGTTTAAPTASNRATGRGIYLLNADQSDALGQGGTERTGGISFASGTSTSPYRIELGEDNNLYIADFSAAGALYRTDADVTSGTNVLDGIGSGANTAVHTTCDSSPIARGSLANGNLVVWAIDGQWPNGYNRILRWNIGAGPLPYNAAPVELGQVGSTTNEVQSDLDIGPDGKLYTVQYRTVSDIGAVRVWDAAGTTVLWNSRSNSPSGTDLFAGLSPGVRALKVSPDGRTLALIRNDLQTWLVGLTNGIPDLSRTNLLLTFSTSTSQSTGREVSWDAAGNLYVANNSTEKMRVWSPGGFSLATTRSDGTFQVITPPALVSVTASAASTVEGAPTNAFFRLTRTSNTNQALTVNYSLSGTATNGVDYATLSGAVTFAANTVATNVALAVIDDAIAELTETVTLTLNSSTNYGIVAPTAATISILDNDTPEIAISVVQSNLLESFAGSKAIFQLTRKGTLNPAVTVNLNYTGGTATPGADFTGPATVVIPTNAVSTNFSISPINDQIYEGTETALVTLASGAGYTIGPPASATAFIIDDDLPPATTLFLDAFDAASTATNWVVNRDDSGADTFATFGYNYSADGIPEAPSSKGVFTPTRGLKFRVNESFGFINGLSASPANRTFTGDYRLRFDMWLNFLGPLGVGGVGSTQHGSGGVGTTGTQAVWPAGNSDGVWFTADGDGDVTDGNPGPADYVVFVGPVIQDESTGDYAAGTGATARGNSNPYYSLWGGVAAPASQLSAHSTQSGTTAVGTLGMSWHHWVITRQGTNVTWDIDGRRVATVDISAVTMNSNVFVGYHDWFSSITTDPSVEFGLVDNVTVETLTVPSSTTILGIQLMGGNVQIDFTGAPTDTTASFALQSAGAAGGTYGTVSATITQQGPGLFRATRAGSGTQQFYRIQRQ